MRYQQHRVSQIVEGQHRVEEGEHHVVELQLVFAAVRDFLDEADAVVPQIADRAAGEARQPGHAHRLVGGHQLLEFRDRVAAFPLNGAGAAVFDGDGVLARAENRCRIDPDEGIPRSAFPSFDALEQKAVLAFPAQLHVRRHRRFGIGEDFLENGYDVAARCHVAVLVRGRRDLVFRYCMHRSALLSALFVLSLWSLCGLGFRPFVRLCCPGSSG